MLICALMLAGATGAQEPAQQLPQPSIVVTTGDAVIRRVPDRTFVTIAVESRAKNPRDAQKQNADAMTSVQQRLTQTKIPKDAVRTVDYGLEQEYDYVANGRVPRGFIARNTIEVRVDDLAHVGEVIDTVVRGGATAVGAGRTVDRVLRIEDSREGIVMPPRPMVMARAADAATPTPIEPGIVEVRAHVTLIVSMK